MQYAQVEGARSEAFSGARGTCPTCGAAMLAKCGPRVRHHWAHAGRRNCDPWWENETDWHRKWKNEFPADCREVIHTAPDGEVHRADVKTRTGIVVELQHSAITDAERLSREAFYDNLVWVLDGSPFRDNFDIYHMLPDPQSALARDVVWFKASRGMRGTGRGLFWRLSENPGSTKTPTGKMVEVHDISTIEVEVHEAYCGHHQYDWVRPRRAWLESSAPVYIDFGEDRLVKLDVYDESGLLCIRYVSKRKFVHDTMTEVSAQALATRFYPITSGPY